MRRVGRVIQTGLFVVNDIKGNELNIVSMITQRSSRVCSMNAVRAQSADSGLQIELRYRQKMTYYAYNRSEEESLRTGEQQ